MNIKGIIVDVQGFKGEGNTFILKEFALSFSQNETINFIIKPPFDFTNLPIRYQKQARWLIKYHHHHQWDQGWTTYEELQPFLQKHLKQYTICVKGEEKRKWVQEMFPENHIVNLEDYGCESFQRLREKYNILPGEVYKSIPNQGIHNVKLLRFFFDFELKRNTLR